MQPKATLKEFKKHRPYKYLLSVLIVALAGLIQYFLWPWIDPAPFLLFYPAVILAALYGDGNTAIVLSAFTVQYFFVSPPMQWPSDYLRLFIFILAAVMIRITHHLKLERLKAEANAEELRRERENREKYVATLTHDLHTPLTATKMNIQMLQRKASDPVM
ncbi:MAG TPA: DUF4118 domain-containing protein [Bacteriovoracaceae bacterium]|nr:DUF4118 domain-containing protein [Bacteriovoracaceae bacterium]